VHATFLQSAADALAVDGSTAFVAIGRYTPQSPLRYELLRIPLPCGAPQSLALQDDDFVGTSLVVADGRLIWASSAGIQSMPTSGGPVRQVLGRALQYPVYLTLAGEELYLGDPSGDIVKIPLASGTPTTMTSGHGAVGALAVDDGYVYFAGLEPFSDDDAGAHTQLGIVYRVPITGGTAEPLASHQQSPNSIVATAGNVYWTNGGTFGVDRPSGPGAVMRLSLSTSTPVVQSVEWDPTDLTLASGTLLWVSDMSSIRKLASGASAAVDIVSGNGLAGPFVTHIAASGSRVYWTQYTSEQASLRSVAIP
jgi:hypothetical protein